MIDALARRRRLAHLIEDYRFADRERQVHAGLTTLMGEAADVLSADHFVPGHVTASAFVTDPGGSVTLLIHHRKLGLWLQPGGHIEPSDPSILAAAMREVFEETGVEARPVGPLGEEIVDLDIHQIPVRGDTPAHAHFDVRFHLVAEAVAPQAGEEVVAARWVPLDEVADYGTDESVLRGLRKVAAAIELDPVGEIQ